MPRTDLEEAGAALARRLLLRWRRPLNDDVFELMSESLLRGLELELERLGVCPRDAHVWEPGRISRSSRAELVTIRALGTPIETCQRCGVWRDKGGNEHE